MTDISQLTLTSLIEYEVYERRSIVQTHINVVGFPELLLTFVDCEMSLCEPVPSIISKPHIIAFIDQSERRSKLRIVCDPEVHVAKKSVHHKYSWFFNFLPDFLNGAWNTVNLTNVAIGSYYRVRLHSVTVVKCDLLESLVGVLG